MRAIVLAGGRGKRLAPLTDLLPKPLLPVGGRAVLETSLRSLGAAGVTDVAIVVGHLGELIRRFVGPGAAFGVRVTYFEQPEQRGSGDAVLCAAPFMDGGPVLVVAGDTAFEVEHVAGLLAFQRERQAEVALCLKRLPPERLAATSSVEVSTDGRVRSFVEKPAEGTAPGPLGAALLHVYPPSLADYLRRVPVSVRGEHELTGVIDLFLAAGVRVYGKEFSLARDLTDTRDMLSMNFDYARNLLPVLAS